MTSSRTGSPQGASETGDTDSYFPARDEFELLLDEMLGGDDAQEGRIVRGTIVGIEDDFAIIDVGLKTEGRVQLKEFGADLTGRVSVKLGDVVDVFLERLENALGETVISREKAIQQEAWTRLEGVYGHNEPVLGAIVGRVKGGFTVDLGGASAFLPGSQVDIRPVRDVGPLMGKEQPFVILKMDRPRGNIVVSRRAILEEARADQRIELVSQLQEGEIREGVVKSITDYGAFVDLGGIDGLLHVTDISWKRVNHPSQVLAVDDTVKVQIVKINPDTQRISLGMKQLQSDPWDGVETKYPVGAKFTGRITNITDYGAFVELEAGVEGLVHVSEMSWTKKHVHPGKIVSTSQEVDVVVLDVDPSKRRVSLGLKQALANPWEAFVEAHPVGSTVEGEVKNATEFGLFVGLDNDIDGMVHLSDIDWSVPGEEARARYQRGDVVKAKVLDVDIEKERISLGIKQLAGDPMSGDTYRKGQIVTASVVEVTAGGIEVRFGEEDAMMFAFIRKSDLSRDRQEQRPERFAVGDRVSAQITNVDKAARRVSLSIKALEIEQAGEGRGFDLDGPSYRFDEYDRGRPSGGFGELLAVALSSRTRERRAEPAAVAPKVAPVEASAVAEPVAGSVEDEILALCDRIEAVLATSVGATLDLDADSQTFQAFAQVASSEFEDASSTAVTMAAITLSNIAARAGGVTRAIASLMVAEALLVRRVEPILLGIVHLHMAEVFASADRPEQQNFYAMAAANVAVASGRDALASAALGVIDRRAIFTT